MQSRKHRQCTESLCVYQRDFNLVAPNTKEPQIQLESYARRAYWDSLLSTLRLFLSFMERIQKLFCRLQSLCSSETE
jgi:hypothetical protein